MRKAASIAGIRRVSAGGGAPSTPTISGFVDQGTGQDGAVQFSWSSGSALTSLQVRWSAASDMSSPTTFSAYSGNITLLPSTSTAIGSAVAGSTYQVLLSALTGTKAADFTDTYYQIRLTNAGGTSAYSAAYGPVSTSFGD